MGTVSLSFYAPKNLPLTKSIEAFTGFSKQYFLKANSSWWARLWRKHVIGELTKVEVEYPWLRVTIDLTHPKRFDTDSEFEMRIEKGLAVIYQHKRS